MKIITDIKQLKTLIDIAQTYAYSETEAEEIIQEWLSQIAKTTTPTKGRS